MLSTLLLQIAFTGTRIGAPIACYYSSASRIDGKHL
jgi:hypothetical protein